MRIQFEMLSLSNAAIPAEMIGRARLTDRLRPQLPEAHFSSYSPQLMNGNYVVQVIDTKLMPRFATSASLSFGLTTTEFVSYKPEIQP